MWQSRLTCVIKQSINNSLSRQVSMSLQSADIMLSVVMLVVFLSAFVRLLSHVFSIHLKSLHLYISKTMATGNYRSVLRYLL